MTQVVINILLLLSRLTGELRFGLMFDAIFSSDGPLHPSPIIRYIGLAIVFLASAFLASAVPDVPAEDQPATYRVVGIASDDALNVRRGPGEKHNPPVARLKNGTPGIQITGPPVMNGNDDWVPIVISDVEGWVRPQYLERVWPAATLADDSLSPDTAGSASESAKTPPKTKSAYLIESQNKRQPAN